MLGALSEKKALIYFASGLRLNGVDNQAQLHATINAAIRAGVSFWPIDARGLVAQAPLGDATHGSPGGIAMYNGASAMAAQDSFQRSQDTLWALGRRYRWQGSARLQRPHQRHDRKLSRPFRVTTSSVTTPATLRWTANSAASRFRSPTASLPPSTTARVTSPASSSGNFRQPKRSASLRTRCCWAIRSPNLPSPLKWIISSSTVPSTSCR